jgi:hypothetical protein
MLRGLADLQRARVEKRSGQSDLARKHYAEFLSRYDRLVTAHTTPGGRS